MNVLHKITLASLKRNRTRTIVTIIGVILSTAMLTAVMVSASSFLHYLREGTSYTMGSWHGLIENTDYASYEDLIQNEEVSTSVPVKQLGYSKLEGSQNEDRPYLFVLGGKEGFENLLPFHLTKGRLPQNANEIVLPSNLGKTASVFPEIGDSLPLELGNRIENGKILLQDDPCRRFSEGVLQFTEEVLEIREKRTFTVVGFYEPFPSFMESYTAPGYTAITLDSLPDEKLSYDLYFTVKEPSHFDEIEKELSFQNIGQNTIIKNKDLLLCLGNAPYSGFFKAAYNMIALVVALIMFGSIALIYNAFSISVSERTKEFGLLSSVGATKKQIRHSVFFEAFVVSALGIPLGILSGILGMGITFHFIGEKFASMGIFSLGSYPSPVKLQLQFPFEFLCISLLVSLVTVFISAWIPSKKATSTSAMATIRQSEEFKSKDVKTSRITRKLFGISGVIASKNYKRSRKKYRTTVLSLFMSVVLFISAYSFTDYLTFASSKGIVQADYDLYLQHPMGTTSPASETEILSAVKKLNSVQKGAFAYRFTNDIIVDKKNISGAVLEKGASLLSFMTPEKVRIFSTFTFVDESSFKELLKQHQLSEKDYMGSTPLAIVLDGKTVYNGNENRYEMVHYLKKDRFSFDINLYKIVQGYHYLENELLENGECVAKYMKNGTENQPEFLTIPYEKALLNSPVKVGKVITETPYFCGDTSDLTIIFPISMANKVFTQFQIEEEFPAFYIKATDHRKASKEIQNLLEEKHLSMELRNVAAEEENSRNFITIIRVFSYGFIVLISLIAAANVFNTISTNVALRKREFAMLRSVGMTKKGLSRMMNFECLLYGFKALLYGLPVSLLVTFLIQRVLSLGFLTKIRIPYAAIGISVAGVFLVVFSSMLYALGKIKKENILEGLRRESI